MRHERLAGLGFVRKRRWVLGCWIRIVGPIGDHLARIVDRGGEGRGGRRARECVCLSCHVIRAAWYEGI